MKKACAAFCLAAVFGGAGLEPQITFAAPPDLSGCTHAPFSIKRGDRLFVAFDLVDNGYRVEASARGMKPFDVQFQFRNDESGAPPPGKDFFEIPLKSATRSTNPISGRVTVTVTPWNKKGTTGTILYFGRHSRPEPVARRDIQWWSERLACVGSENVGEGWHSARTYLVDIVV